MSAKNFNAHEFNREAWDRIATSEQRWFTPATDQQIEQARAGQFAIRLTATKDIPTHWMDGVTGKKVLALGGGGGHQGPILAAVGADVTVVDLSDQQLEIDRQMGARHGLSVTTLQADMTDLGQLESESFDWVINPCSVNFVADVRPVWRHAARVLKPGGGLIAGVMQPVNFLFDAVKRDRGKLKVRFKIPYSDLDLPPDELQDTLGPERPIDFGHSLTDLVGGQLDAGLVLTDIMEDQWGGGDVLSEHIATFLVTRAVKLSS
ncbi:class I SAM-dependent methyltransferase [Planctomycetes bacterium SV_7m_r]|uniref:class I SAM-dependent methyltransferase n=1 Tax=Stieleria bergensis TaxID=2528025 RepID=UPI00119D9987